ncbi:MAG: hypothetical protein HQM00_00760 [Magnetococcales bacterium]|nr:hypothetical protein [Magnetococcales bacterium]
MSFLSFQWKELDCLEAWIASLRKFYPSVRFVVMETLERIFLNRFTTIRPQPCQQPPMKPTRMTPGMTLSQRSWSVANILPDPFYAISATVNSFRPYLDRTVLGGAIVTPLIRADLFSNRRSDLLLFQRADLQKAQWNPEAIRQAAVNVQRLQQIAREQGISLIMLVVPDKSTAYARFLRTGSAPLSPTNLWDLLEEHGVHQVNFEKTLLPALSVSSDFYLPNDSHLSTRGYIFMGKAVADFLLNNPPD